MTRQLTMFEAERIPKPERLRRRTDPQTSHDAAVDVRKSLGVYHAAVFAVSSESESMTARELAEKCVEKFSGDRETYRKRMKELVTLGHLVTSGSRNCSVTGKMATVYLKGKES